MNKTDNTKRYGLLLFLLCWTAYFSAYIARSNYAVFITEIMSSGGYSKASMGLVGTCFFLFYGIGQLVNGMLADRLPPTKMISVGLIVSSFTNAAMGLANSSVMLMVVWSINGLALSMVWSPIIKIFSVYMPIELKKRAAINISTTIPAGTLAAYGLGSLVFWAAHSWRAVFFVSGGTVFCLAVVYSIFIDRVVAKLPVKQDIKHEVAEIKGGKGSFLPIFLRSGILIVALAVMFNGIIKDGVNMWIPTYLKERYSISTLTTILTVAIIPIFNLSGIYLGQSINNKVQHELKSTGIIFAVAAGVLLALALGVNNYIVAIVLLAITTALMLGANSMMLSVFPLYFARFDRTATVTGFLNFSSYAASAISTYAFGAISERYGWTATQWVWVAVALLGCAAALGASINRFSKVYKYQ